MTTDYNSPYEIKTNKDGTLTLYFLVGEDLVAQKMTIAEAEKFYRQLKDALDD